MRLSLVAILIGLTAATAGAEVINVPDPDESIRSIQQGLLRADPGDTVLLSSGVFDSVSTFLTPWGLKTAIASIPDGVILMGVDRRDSRIDYTNAEYGILCMDVGEETRIENLSIGGGIGRDQGRADDADVRTLVAGITCLKNASPTIRDLSIQEGATGIIVNENSAPIIETSVIARGSHHGVYVYMNGATPAVIDHVSLVQNFDMGVYVFNGSVSVRNCSITHNGKHGVKSYLSDPILEYNNVYWNDRIDPDSQTGPLNYGGLDDLTGVDGNISVEPFYCDFFGSAGYDYHVCFEESPNLEADEFGAFVGVYGGGCDNCVSSPVEPTTWGAIKALYR